MLFRSQVKSLQSGLEALGFPAGEPEVLLGQFVKIVKGDQEVKISKRAGTIVTVADLLDEVDPDVARMTFLLQGIDTPMTFDLEAVASRSMDNPVYYVQYAHARVMSIARRAEAEGVARRPLADVDLSPLVHEREVELLRALAVYPDVVAEAADLRAPQKISTWVRDFARAFHGFYRDVRVLTDDDATTQARLWLVEACRIGLAAALITAFTALLVATRGMDDRWAFYFYEDFSPTVMVMAVGCFLLTLQGTIRLELNPPHGHLRR